MGTVGGTVGMIVALEGGCIGVWVRVGGKCMCDYERKMRVGVMGWWLGEV